VVSRPAMAQLPLSPVPTPALTRVRRRPPARQWQKPVGAVFLVWPSQSQLPGLEPHRQVRRPPRQPEDRQSATCLARAQALLQERAARVQRSIHPDRVRSAPAEPSNQRTACGGQAPPVPACSTQARQCLAECGGNRLFSHSLRLLRPDALCDLDLQCRPSRGESWTLGQGVCHA
jgi:hypothetical protein